MKKLYYLGLIIVTAAISGCGPGGTAKQDRNAGSDTTTVPDTGFTGIKQYMSGTMVLKEVTFRNGIREGVTKTFDRAGKLYQTFWYENDLKEDSSCWYFPEGQVFRTTPYKHDTIDGIQKQYYRTGRIRAKIGFSKGMRTTFFQEYESNGKLYTGYPLIVVNLKDEYASKGLYQVGLELSDKSTKVKFYRGDFIDGRFDSTACRAVKTLNGKAVIDLRKSGSPQPEDLSVIAEISTPFGNRFLTSEKIRLPYKDLK